MKDPRSFSQDLEGKESKEVLEIIEGLQKESMEDNDYKKKSFQQINIELAKGYLYKKDGFYPYRGLEKEAIQLFNGKLDQLSLLEITLGGYFQGIQHRAFSFEGGLLFYSDQMEGRSWKKDFSIKREDFFESLKNLDLGGWDPTYWNPSMVDGEEWELVLSFIDGSKKKFRGSNSYPYNFHELVQLCGLK